jgi:Anti-sigma-28 factor, FlgM
MAVGLVTKGTLSDADDATLESGMDRPDNPSPNPIPNPIDDQGMDEERLKKIARLKQAVAEGTYHITAEQLADKLIEHMLEPKG